MRARKLRSKVTIQKATRTENSHGEPVATWATYTVDWATITPISGREYFQAQQEQADVTHKFFFRYTSKLAGINPQDYRVSYDGNIYDLISPPLNINNMNKEIQIMGRLHYG